MVRAPVPADVSPHPRLAEKRGRLLSLAGPRLPADGDALPRHDLARPALRSAAVIILGLDPSLSSCGWGIVRADGNRLAHVANGQIKTKASLPLATRLAALADALEAVVAE